MAQRAATGDDDLVEALAQRERRSIIEHILKRHMNISDLARETNLDRATVAYHLSILEQAGVVDSEYEMLKKPSLAGRVGRYYRARPDKLREAAQLMLKISKSLLGGVEAAESTS